MEKFKKFVRLVIVVLFVLVTLASAEAGWLGPSNYDECILENMEGVNNDLAAKAVIRSCRETFPLPRLEVRALPFDVLTMLHSKGAGIWEDGYFRANIGNGDREWIVNSLVIRITDKSTNTYRDYNVHIMSAFTLTDESEISPYDVHFEKMFPSRRLDYTIHPQEWSGVEVKLFEKPDSWSWSIVSGKGYRK